MCVAMPSRVLSVDAGTATVESEGRQRKASTLLIPDIAPGEWVMVAAGTIVQRLSADEAREITDALMTAIRLAGEASSASPGRP
jgi:hydrogenase expression/formation protein HypC